MKQRNAGRFWLLLVMAGLLSLSACEDEVDLDIPESAPILVVDAWLGQVDTSQYISLSQSTPLLDNETTSPVTDAAVSLWEGDVEHACEHVGSGRYRVLPEYLSADGVDYTLQVKTNDGKLFESTTKYYPVPPIDSIVPEKRVDEAFGPDGWYAQFYARDLPGLGNCYWIKTYKNGVFLNQPAEMNIAFDAAFDPGAMVDNLIFITPIRELINPALTDEDVDNDRSPYKLGDHIRVEIHSISPRAFEFMVVLRDQLINAQSGIFASPIANTVSNLKPVGHADPVLGVFNLARISSAEATVE